jgi:hypothetical protein
MLYGVDLASKSSLPSASGTAPLSTCDSSVCMHDFRVLHKRLLHLTNVCPSRAVIFGWLKNGVLPYLDMQWPKLLVVLSL